MKGRIACVLCMLWAVGALALTPSGLLEIHYINVQNAGATLIIGPDGTTILMDGGNNGDGIHDIVPYFNSIGLTTADELDYMIAAHLDGDHVGGLDEVIYAGYDVLHQVYYNGSSKRNADIYSFFDAANGTTAGPAIPMALGTTIQLGNGATAKCVAVHGNILGDGSVSVTEENDKSIAILVNYGEFQYLFTSDLGGGEDDYWCTGRGTATNYANVETPLVSSLRSPWGANLLGPLGVEVAHVAHHGSESSTNKDYMNELTPRVACVNVGANQGSGWDFPRKDVVDKVLRAQASCITVPAAIVLQTEEGSGSPDTDRSYSGYCVGDIVIKTNGQRLFYVDGTGRRSYGPDERASIGLPRYFPLDEDTTDHVVPAAISDLRATGGPQPNQVTLRWTATGDDGTSGRAALYDIRYRSSTYGPIDTEAEWNLATRGNNIPLPETTGTFELFIVSGLTPDQGYYFAMKVIDDNLNYSSLSNSPMAIAGHPPVCDYVLGDINGDGYCAGSDVTYGVRHFKGTGPVPPDSCYMDSTGTYLYVAGDVNGNCEFRGSDLTKLVSFFKGTTTLSYCHFFPPPLLRH